jgi:probable rRNA maturation factor
VETDQHVAAETSDWAGDGIVVEVTDSTRSRIDRERVAAMAAFVLAEEGVDAAELGVHLVGERRIRMLNREHRGLDEVTDVLSFPLEDEGEEPMEGVPRLLGDVVLCPVQARRQAEADGTPPAFETALLIVHGVLHLLGWDHEVHPAPMAMRQAELLATFDWSGLA